MDNKRSYGTILVGKTKPEDRAPSPCMRYFIDANGNQITDPEEYTPPENAGWLEPESYWSKEMEEETVRKIENKPTAEELRADQLTMNKLQAMKKYNCAKATIERWTREFGLPHWKQSWERGTETQNKAVLPSEGSPAIDSAPGGSPNAPEPNMEAQEVVKLETMPAEPEVLEELSTLDDIPFGEEPTEEEILVETGEGKTAKWSDLWPDGDSDVVRIEMNPKRAEIGPEECKKLLDELNNMDLAGHISLPDDPDEADWRHIENEIRALYELKHNRMVDEFQRQLRRIMEGVGA